MAVDTRDKRFSMMGLANVNPSMMADPDASIDGPDRAMLIFLYHGITLAAPAGVVGNLLFTYPARMENEL